MLSEQRTVERPGEQGATLAGAGRAAHQKVGDRRQGLSSGSDPREECGSLAVTAYPPEREDSGMALCPEGLAGSRVR